MVLSALLAAIIILTLLGHWLAFRLARVLLPKDRTALYLVPIVTLICGCIAALRIPSRAAEVGRRVLVFVLFSLAIILLMCMRLKYFKEWKYDAEVAQAYSVIMDYNRVYGIRDVPTHWAYSSSLNFYNALLNQQDRFQEFSGRPSYPEDKNVYVLYYPEDEQFIHVHGLKVVYHGDLTDIVVAIKPEVEIQPAKGGQPCRQ